MLEEQGQLENFCARLSAAQTELVTEDEALLAATSNINGMIYALKDIAELEWNLQMVKDDANRRKGKVVEL